MLRLATAPARAQTVENDADTTSSSSGALRLRSIRDSQLEEFDIGSQSIQIDFGKYGSMDESFVSPERVASKPTETKESEAVPIVQDEAGGKGVPLNGDNGAQELPSNLETRVTRPVAPPSTAAPAPPIASSSTIPPPRSSPRKSPRKPTSERNDASTSNAPNVSVMPKIIAPPTSSRYERQPRPRSDSVDSMIDDPRPRNREEFLRHKERAEYEARLLAEEKEIKKKEAPLTRAPKSASPTKPTAKQRENSDTTKLTDKGKGKQVEAGMDFTCTSYASSISNLCLFRRRRHSRISSSFPSPTSSHIKRPRLPAVCARERYAVELATVITFKLPSVHHL